MNDEPESKPAAASTAGPAQTTAQRFASEIKLGLRRIAQGDFQQIKASDEERAELLAAARPVVPPLAQDYAAWRKSILIVASVLLVIAAGFKVVKFQSFEGVLVESQMETARQQDPTITVDRVREYVVQTYGRDNLDTINLLFIMDLSVILLAAFLVVLAARGWARIRPSRRMARRAWYVWMLLPICMAMIPWAGLLEFKNVGDAQAEQMRTALGLLLGLSMVVMLGPKIVALFPGVIRSGLILKTLVPETGHPIWAAMICAPLFILTLILTVATILQIQGDALLLFGVLCFILAPISYLRHARILMRPMEGDDAARLVGEARKWGYVLNLLGATLVTIFVLKHELVTWDGAIVMIATALGGLFLMMVVTSDFLLALLHTIFQQAGELYGTKKAEALEQRLGALSEGGLTELRTPAELLSGAGPAEGAEGPDA
jgi:hypothetical protein